MGVDRLDRFGMPRTMQQDAVIALPQFLLADELERVAQGRDARLDRGLHVLAFQLQAVDFALNVLEARLRFLEQQIGARLGLARDALRFGFRRRDDARGFGIGRGLDVVR